jgi:hypothetical protein
MKAPELLNLVGGILHMQTKVEGPATLVVLSYRSVQVKFRASRGALAQQGIADSGPLLQSLLLADSAIEM